MPPSNSQSSIAAPNLAGRVAIVTGGADGIGRATALLLARHGARVVVGDLHLRGENAVLFADLQITERSCDVRVESEVAALVSAAVAAHGRLDILVNNAGVGLVKPITAIYKTAS